VLPGLTASGHVLLGRSYAFDDTMDDLQLCTTRVAGKYAHVGFSLLLLGRLDGLNEHNQLNGILRLLNMFVIC